jgi:phospholipase C
MRRRDALRSIGALAGAGAASRLLPGCGDNLEGRRAGPDGGGGPTEGITTLVVVMMENRSYDHYLAARTLLEGLPGDGLREDMANPDDGGSPISIHRETDYCIPDPPHGWDSSRVQWNKGANDGFLRAYREDQGAEVPPHVMGYFARDDIPLTWALADHHASCDAWFSSLLGPTWPNRLYLHSGQSNGLISNDLPNGRYNWRAVEHQLLDAGIPWAYYFSDLPFVPLFRDIPVDGYIKDIDFFFDDAAAGTLPPLTVVEPGFGINDDHPPHHPILGQAFLASVYAALASSPQWNNCLLVVTYDEHGGFFDHVSPPRAADDRAAEGFDQLGFRVPTVVAGPYVKPGHVSSVVRDHTSVLSHLGGMLGLEPLTARVAAAEDLSELIDQDRLAALEPSAPAEVPAIEVDESTIEGECYGRGATRVVEPTDLEKLADSGFFARLDPRLDRRGRKRDVLYLIGDALERLNAGRIRRGR